MTDTRLRISRRHMLAGIGSFVAWARQPRQAFAGPQSDPRLVIVLLRGAVDGLGLAPPTGDPVYAGLRGADAIGAGGIAGTLPLDTDFAINAAMPGVHQRFSGRTALVVHAVASPYRDRSHFDGQDVLESGLAGIAPVTSGWLNRVVAALPSGERLAPTTGALAVAATLPRILLGPAPSLTWMPHSFRPVGDGTQHRLVDLYDRSAPDLAAVLRRGLAVDALALRTDLAAAPAPTSDLTDTYRRLAAGAGALLADPGGPRIAALSFDGWDTHTEEGAGAGQLSARLAALDAAFTALAEAMGVAWRQTVVVAVTEFGRTVRMNGSDGTDHGTATAALVLGGAVNGGQVIADWPGLRPADLHQGRDLRPTIDLRAVFKGVLRDHLGLSDRVLASDVFPDSGDIRPLAGLIA